MENLKAFLAKVRHKSPPYCCPVTNCSRSYRSFCGIQFHLTNFNHETPDANDSSNLTQSPTSTLSRKMHRRKRTRFSLKSYRNRTPTTANEKCGGLQSLGYSPRSLGIKRLDPLTFADSQRIVEFDLAGTIHRYSIYDKLEIIVEVKPPLTPSIPACDAKQRRKEAEERSRERIASMDIRRSGRVIPKKTDPMFESPKERRSVNTGKENEQRGEEPTVVDTPVSRTSNQKLVSQQVRESDDAVSVSPIGEMPSAYYKFIEKTCEDLDEAVEYDMDDEDYKWLALVNDSRKQGSISEDVFELLMDRFEKEAYFESMQNGIKVTNIDEDAVCCICLDGECHNSNAILFCDMCNLAVHQECYGVPYIPEGQWLCRRCLASPSIGVECCLCPNRGGAFKQTNTGGWCHVMCAMWVPEVSFANHVFLEPIEGIEGISSSRWRLKCYICKESKVGACIQCHEPKCYQAFHVTCAQQAGLYMKIEAAKNAGSSIRQAAFCHVHTPPNSDCVPMISHAESPTPSPTGSPKFRQTLKIQRARKQLAQQRSGNPVIVSLPTISDQKLEKIAAILKLEAKKSFMKRLLAYWTLKRQSRAGVPLIRRLLAAHAHSAASSQSDSQMGRVRETLRVWQRLRQDLEKVRLLIELIRKREKLKREQLRVSELEAELRVRPLSFLLRHALTRLRELDTNRFFQDPVDSEVPDYYDEIKHPMDFSAMQQKIQDGCYRRVGEFVDDFNLIISNCCRFNPKDTIYHKSRRLHWAAVRLREEATSILEEVVDTSEAVCYDSDTGCHLDLSELRNTTPSLELPDIPETLESILPNEVRLDMPLEEQLDILLDSMDAANRSNKGKLARQIHKEIVNIRRKLATRRKGVPESPHTPVSASPGLLMMAQPEAHSTLKTERTNGFVNGHAHHSNTSDAESTSSSCATPVKSGVGRRTQFLFQKRRREEPKREPELLPDRKRHSSTSGRCSPIKQAAISNGHSKLEQELTEDDDSTGERLCSADLPKRVTRHSSSSATTSMTEMPLVQQVSSVHLQPLDIVWAKCPTYPWYPALIFNPAWKSGYEYSCGVRVPQPPPNVLQDHGDDFLVVFFDEPKTWQWVKREKMEPLGGDQQLDEAKLNDCKKPRWRSDVRKAFQRAVQHQTRVDQHQTRIDHYPAKGEQHVTRDHAPANGIT